MIAKPMNGLPSLSAIEKVIASVSTRS